MPDRNEVAAAPDMRRDELDQLHPEVPGVVLNSNTAHEGEKDLTLVDLLADEDSIEPSAEPGCANSTVICVTLSSARSSPSGRGRLVPRRANIAGSPTRVTVGRISQLKQALLMLQEGIDANAGERPIPPGAWSTCKATFAEGIATACSLTVEEINLIESDAPALTAQLT